MEEEDAKDRLVILLGERVERQKEIERATLRIKVNRKGIAKWDKEITLLLDTLREQ